MSLIFVFNLPCPDLHFFDFLFIRVQIHLAEFAVSELESIMARLRIIFPHHPVLHISLDLST